MKEKIGIIVEWKDSLVKLFLPFSFSFFLHSLFFFSDLSSLLLSFSVSFFPSFSSFLFFSYSDLF
jgi:hypothetical protein